MPEPEYQSGAELILLERLRQVTDEGYTPDHDASHTNNELSKAANAYMLAAAGVEGLTDGRPPSFWPFEDDAFKPGKDPIRALTKAGALIAAEIDRLKARLGQGDVMDFVRAYTEGDSLRRTIGKRL